MRTTRDRIRHAVWFEIIGLAILVVRVRGPLMAAASPMLVSTSRYGPPALMFLIVNITILTYLVINYFSQELPPPLHRRTRRRRQKRPRQQQQRR